MKIKPLCSLVICLISLWSCTLCSTKKVTCSQFNDPQFSLWFPYTVGSQLKFKAMGTTDSLEYTIKTFYKSEAYETTQGGFSNNIASCYSTASIVGYNQANQNSLVDIYYSISADYQLSIKINDADWRAGKINPNSVSNIFGSNFTKLDSSYNTTFANGIVYPVLITMENDTINDKTSRPFKIYLAKNAGIIGFDEYPSKKKWILQ